MSCKINNNTKMISVRMHYSNNRGNTYISWNNFVLERLGWIHFDVPGSGWSDDLGLLEVFEGGGGFGCNDLAGAGSSS